MLVPSRVDRRTAVGRRIYMTLERFGLRVGPAIRQRSAHIEAFDAGAWIGAHAPASPAYREIRVLRDRILELLEETARSGRNQPKELPSPPSPARRSAPAQSSARRSALPSAEAAQGRGSAGAVQSSAPGRRSLQLRPRKVGALPAGGVLRSRRAAAVRAPVPPPTSPSARPSCPWPVGHARPRPARANDMARERRIGPVPATVALLWSGAGSQRSPRSMVGAVLLSHRDDGGRSASPSYRTAPHEEARGERDDGWRRLPGHLANATRVARAVNRGGRALDDQGSASNAALTTRVARRKSRQPRP